MAGRRWSDGLHQAVEAKEHVKNSKRKSNPCLHYLSKLFRLYTKLAGMTGTADTEAYEFQQIYHLEVVVIPTHLPISRQDLADQIYLTKEEKFAAIIEDIKACRARKQPVLVVRIDWNVGVSVAIIKQRKKLVIKFWTQNFMNTKHKLLRKPVAQERWRLRRIWPVVVPILYRWQSQSGISTAEFRRRVIAWTTQTRMASASRRRDCGGRATYYWQWTTRVASYW